MKIILVSWIDAIMEEAAMELKHALVLKPKQRRNTGFLISEDDKQIIMAFGEIESDSNQPSFLEGIMVIPKCMILKVVNLNET